MNSFKCVVAYEGTRYAGWQVQLEQTTVAGVLEKTFENVFGSKIKVLGASRTDAGVHAHGQVAQFLSTIDLPSERMMRVWNHRLPDDILIRSLERVSLDFNPRYDVKQKTYHYHLFTEFPHPFYSRYGIYWPYKLNLELLEASLMLFVGQHDFRSFCTGNNENTVRRIDEISLTFDQTMGAYRIEIRGRSFLQHMIRRIVGGCLKIASFGGSIEVLKDALAQKDPKQELLTAPACGLMLYQVDY